MPTFLTVFFCFQLGWIPNGNINFYESKQFILIQPFDATFKIDAKIFDIVKIGGECRSFFSIMDDKSRIINFSPTGMTYQIYFGIEPIQGISLIYEHSCSHPVAAYARYSPGNFRLDATFDRIYFEIKGKLSFN